MLELWGGHECTANRIRDSYRDQTLISGHEVRIGDLDRFAALGCRALRYPVLWERVSPSHPELADWRWSDARLQRLKSLSIRPIVGLTHHGSGPLYTHLLDPDFATGLAAHAEAVARRYDWIEDWTPVNEPLTTARFSALYGHWYPHAIDEAAFWTALLNQIDAVRLSMRGIRRVRPEARLIQTEDLGRTYATAPLQKQAEFENLRRWLTWDLLSGRVDRQHGLFDRLSRHGLADRLLAIADAPCPPDVLGVNHYLTSERFLDHRVERYPSKTWGGSDIQAYADVEAVRVLVPEPDGLEGVLREAHARYGLPIAVTEIHNGCTREEQMRWLLDAWRTAQRLRQEGVAIEAVTAWSLLGAFDWDSLLTRSAGRYEAGAFDVSGLTPRPTGVASLMKALADGAAPPPAALGAGWWRRDIRLEHRPVRRESDDLPPRRFEAPEAAPPLVIVGLGALCDTLTSACLWRGLAYRTADLDIDASAVAALIDEAEPWAVVGVADMAGQWLAACAARWLPLMLLLNDGSPSPAMEQRVLAVCSHALVARLEPAPDARAMIDAALDLLIDGERGVCHLADPVRAMEVRDAEVTPRASAGG